MKSKDKEQDLKEKHDAKHPSEDKKSPESKAGEKAVQAEGLAKAAAQSEDPAKVMQSDPAEVSGPTRDANLAPSEEELKQKQIECDKDGCDKLVVDDGHLVSKEHAGIVPAEGMIDGKAVSSAASEPSKGSSK